MSMQTLKDALPEYAKDLKLNLGSLASETVLGDAEKFGTFIAAAIASRNPEVIEAITRNSRRKWTSRRTTRQKPRPPSWA